MKAYYPLRFSNSVVNEFQKGKDCGDESFIIPLSLLEITKPFIFAEMSLGEPNDIKPKYCLKKLHKYINNSFMMVMTRKLEIYDPCFLQMIKTILNCVLSIKGIVLVLLVYVTLVKPNIMQKLDGMNIII